MSPAVVREKGCWDLINFCSSRYRYLRNELPDLLGPRNLHLHHRVLVQSSEDLVTTQQETDVTSHDDNLPIFGGDEQVSDSLSNLQVVIAMIMTRIGMQRWTYQPTRTNRDRNEGERALNLFVLAMNSLRYHHSHRSSIPHSSSSRRWVRRRLSRVTPGALRRNRKSRETRPDESKRQRAQKRTGGKKKDNMRWDLGLVAENGTGEWSSS
jgi:hypothetical protein